CGVGFAGGGNSNADIVAIRMETEIRYYAATDSAGRFVVDLLPPGQYSARAEVEGNVAGIVASDPGRDRSGGAVDVEAEGGGAEGSNHGHRGAADGGVESELGIGVGR